MTSISMKDRNSENAAEAGESAGSTAERAMLELGQLGCFHVRCHALVALTVVSAALYGLTYVFLADEVPYRCAVPECEAVNSTEFSPPWLDAALPQSGRSRRCSRRGVVETIGADGCAAPDFGTELQPCESWLYASNDTIVAEFGLACQEWKRTLVGTVHNVAMLVSLPIFGYISDRWGRKMALVLSCTLVGAVGTLKAFAVSYEMYISIEFLETLAGASAFPTAYVYTVELLGRSGRAIAAALLSAMLVVGGLLFALLAKTFHYWRTFILVAYPPSLLFFTYVFLLPESVRWLLSKGRRREAADIVIQAARFNRVTLSDKLLRQLETESQKVLDKSDATCKNSTGGTGGGGAAVLEALRSRILARRLAICSWWWVSCTFVFYGLAINSVSLAGDKYTNYMLVVSVELVAVAANALLLDRAGRRRTLLGAFVLCGAACTSIAFVPANLPWVVTLLYLVGKIGITMAFGGVYMYTSELFPTSARHSLLGTCSMVGRLGSIVAPQTPLLTPYAEWLPAALFGSAAALSALLMLSTPETLNVALPDTVRDAELLGVVAEPARPPSSPAPSHAKATSASASIASTAIPSSASKIDSKM